MMRRLGILLLGVCALLGEVRTAFGQGYQATDLGTLGGPTARARALNNDGRVVGRSSTLTGRTHAFEYVDVAGVPWDMGVPLGGRGSGAQDVNDLDVIVGHSGMPGKVRHAIAIGGEVFLAGTDLGTLGGPNSGASAINNRGWVTGNADLPVGVEHAFLVHAYGDTSDPLEIPDLDAAGISDSILVPDSFTIADVNVSLEIDHTWIGDLCVTLTAPGGAPSVALVQRPGAEVLGDPCHLENPFGCWSVNLSVILDDEGSGGPIEFLCGPDPELPTPGSPPNYQPNEALSLFAGMDAAGEWTLTVSDNAGFDRGTLVRWSLHFMEDLGALQPGGNSAGLGINESGIVSGVSTVPGGAMDPCIFFPGPFILDLGTFGGIRGAANDINDDGMVVGYADDEFGAAMAFQWFNEVDGKIPLGTLGGAISVATAVNAQGTICGFSTLGFDAREEESVVPHHAFVYVDGGMIDIHPPEFVSSEAYDINDHGVIVGVGVDVLGNAHALRWCPVAHLVAATYVCDDTLPRIGHNVLRYFFDAPITVPAPGEIQIRELLPAGVIGDTDYSEWFNISVTHVPELLGPDLWVLRLEEDGCRQGTCDFAPFGPACIGGLDDGQPCGSVLTDEHWYAVMNDGWWCGAPDFKIDYAVVYGDASNDWVNQFSDLSVINVNMSPLHETPDDSRYDINTFGGVSFADLSATFASLGSSVLPSKPEGHECFPDVPPPPEPGP